MRPRLVTCCRSRKHVLLQSTTAALFCDERGCHFIYCYPQICLDLIGDICGQGKEAPEAPTTVDCEDQP